jgi:two-component system cell cycle sensor histidine kinase/response regulator CckA
MTAAVLYASNDIEANKEPNQMEPTLHPRLCKGTILVMDDDAMMQKLFIIMLKYLGYESVCTFEGAEALRLYKQARDDGNPFTGVILDLHNRLGKGGIETLVDLRELDPEVKAVICSADTDAPVMNQFLSHGFRGTLAKPFGLNDLDNILKYIF